MRRDDGWVLVSSGTEHEIDDIRLQQVRQELDKLIVDEAEVALELEAIEMRWTKKRDPLLEKVGPKRFNFEVQRLETSDTINFKSSYSFDDGALKKISMLDQVTIIDLA